MTFLLFLSSGLFLGWSLGANDAANVFGSAVGSRMIRFPVAAAICAIFILLGAVFSGAGAAHTLGRLGTINAIGGAFATALSAAITVYLMSSFRLPVSTGQAIVGAIIGWNIFSGTQTDLSQFQKIFMTWVLCPILAAITAVCLYKLISWLLAKANPHLLTLDSWIRWGLAIAGAFGSYSLGANNIGNVMGVFINSAPFTESTFGALVFSAEQKLFMLGGVAIAIGVFTYSKRVMLTVGNGLMPLTPMAAFVVVMSHSVVLFLFASEGLEYFLASHGLPTIPLVPLSSSQAVVGAIIGIGLLKRGQQLNWGQLSKIALGWVTTPVMAMGLALLIFSVTQNLFMVKVYTPVEYKLSSEVIERLESNGIRDSGLVNLQDKTYTNASDIRRAIISETKLDGEDIITAIDLAQIDPISVQLKDSELVDLHLTNDQYLALKKLDGKTFHYSWQMKDDLERLSDSWVARENSVLNKKYNQQLQHKYDFLLRLFSTVN